jgi:hypothetical protein
MARKSAVRVTQPRIGDLLRGRIDLFSTDALIDMLARLGVGVRLVIKPAKAKLGCVTNRRLRGFRRWRHGRVAVTGSEMADRLAECVAIFEAARSPESAAGTS